MRPFSPNRIATVLPDLLAYLPVTLLLIAVTALLGTLLGLGLAWAKVSGHRFGRPLSNAYTSAMRCTPPIVLLFIVYYGLPELLFFAIGVDINSLHKSVFVIVTFTLLFAATLSEVMRSAYESVDKGQREAAVSVGLSESQAFRRITLPQATVVALPNLANALANLMKDGSLAYTIGLIDMMGRGNLIISKNYGAHALETYVALAAIYWGMTILIEQSFSVLERRLSRGLKSIAA